MGYILPVEFYIHVGDVGTRMRVQFMRSATRERDISDATVMKIAVRTPDCDGVSKEHDARFVTDGHDGMIEYDLEEGECAVAGEYQIQGYIETPSGKWHSQTRSFTVKGNL